MITERKIYMCAANMKVLEKGLSLQQNNKVTKLNFSNTDYSINGAVDDYQNYQTKIILNKQNNIVAHSCTCDSAPHLNGACEHVIATLKQAQVNIEKSRHQSVQQEKNINEIFNAFLSYNEETTLVKTDIKIHIHFEHIITTNTNMFTLYLKAGLDKLYVIRNLREFLDAFKYNDEIEYGKAFTLNSEYHQIPVSLKPFFKALDDMIDEGNAKFRSPKDLLINEHYFKKIIQSLMHQKIFLTIHQQNYQCFITDEKYHHPLTIVDQPQALKIDLRSFKNVIPLTSDYELILEKHYIYSINRQELMHYLPFFKAAQTTDTFLEFKNQYKEQFITQIIPHLPKETEIPDSLQKSYIKATLDASLFLDKEDNQIIARPIFKYGQYEFNPINHYENIKLDDKLLIRQIKKEEELMNLLDNANFKVHPGHLYIDQQEDVLEFVTKYLPILQDNMSIFYSDNFKSIVKRKKINSAIRYNSDSNLFEISFNYEGISHKDLMGILNAYRLKQKYYRLIDGSFISLDDQDSLDLIDTLEHLDIDIETLNHQNLPLTLTQALYIAQNLDIDEQNDLYFKKIVEQITHPEKIELTPPNLSVKLRDYQLVGYHWLKTLAHYHLGGILADDMGLGKTLQAITFLTDATHQSQLPNLIICPTSLVYNWESEIRKFNPNLKYLIISGNAQTRQSLINTIKDYQVIITSYPLIKKDIHLYSSINFNHCILDEAQYIKNANSLSAKSVKQIKSQTRFALTGTPIENSLSELWSIFDFIMPGMLLSEYKFKELYEFPIIKEQDFSVRKKLISRISPFILRRMKSDVLEELPDKIETKLVVDLLPKQKELYLAFLNETRQNIKDELNDSNNRIKILAALTRLRQLCNHPALFLENYYGSSGKIDALNEIIDEAIESNNKILIFSQFTTMLHLIEEQLKLKEIKYGYLDGSTPMELRTKMVSDFNEGDCKIFLISLKAGGTGLNLTGANMVIHVDPWWNPAVEQQATDRAYRIGQKRNVQVIKLISKGTIEEKIYDLQCKKLDLIDSVIQPGETFISKLSEDELLHLFE